MFEATRQSLYAINLMQETTNISSTNQELHKISGRRLEQVGDESRSSQSKIADESRSSKFDHRHHSRARSAFAHRLSVPQSPAPCVIMICIPHIHSNVLIKRVHRVHELKLLSVDILHLHCFRWASSTSARSSVNAGCLVQ